MDIFDHGCGSVGQGQLLPHGVYTVVNNHVHIHLNASHNASHDTSDL
jgi:hypothetical protein